jgi:hypothetical protein
MNRISYELALQRQGELLRDAAERRLALPAFGARRSTRLALRFRRQCSRALTRPRPAAVGR